jgi:hypothetical protein
MSEKGAGMWEWPRLFPFAVAADNRRHGGDSHSGERRGMYFANVSISGPVKYRDVSGSIGVLDALENHMPIGTATCCGRDFTRLAWWKLKVRGKDLPGLWVIFDRRFIPAQRKGRHSFVEAGSGSGSSGQGTYSNRKRPVAMRGTVEDRTARACWPPGKPTRCLRQGNGSSLARSYQTLT